MTRAYVFAAIAAASVGMAAPLAAQQTRSGEIVQALPPAGATDLSNALQRLARNPADIDALIAAGNASLEIDDIDAAIGFFGRAGDLAPADPRVKLGVASAYVRSRRPVEALRLFAEADAAGAQTRSYAAERGLAFDLVGDNASAQGYYRLALQQADDRTIRRRIAISQAIAGERQAFEATLLPMLQAQDNAAFRARALGLAILGSEKEARSIVEAMMPPQTAALFVPYLARMRDLNPAEQAAAAHLGVFPGEGQRTNRTASVVTAPAGIPKAVAALPEPARPLPSAPPIVDAPVAALKQEAGYGPVTGVLERTNTAPVPELDVVFADFANPRGVVPPTAGAIDLRTITPQRDAAPAPAKAKPAEPARIWVQVATGSDIAALKFDWRRIARKANGLLDDLGPFVADWGQTRRLLAGPFASTDAAKVMGASLRQAGIDTFRHVSEEGQTVRRLD